MVSLSSPTANAAAANPNAQQVAQAKAANFCSDPWITWGIWWVTASTRNPSGVGTTGECNPQLYNGGSWNSFDQLQQAIHDSLNAIAAGGARITLADIGSNRLQVTTDLGSGFATTVIVAGHLVASGGGNLVASGGGNLISQDGATLVASGGGNYHVLSVDQKGLNLPGNRILIVTRPAAPAPPPPPPPTANNGICGDAWVTSAIRLVTGRAPNGSGNSGECLTTRYGGGHWVNQTDLAMKVGAAFGWPRGTCSDSWIVMATLDVKGTLPLGTGTSQQCAPANYSGGHWASYNGPQMPSLINGVKAYWGVR